MHRTLTAKLILLLLASAPMVGLAYEQAPMLAERVANGTLPPVEQRLPENPAVVEPIHEPGRYGGTWRRMARSPGDMGLNSRLNYEPLLRWNRSGDDLVPGIAQSWRMNDDATEFTFHLRQGMKWSDGHPFTSADFAFTHQYIEQNPRLTLAHLQWKVLDGELMQVETPDPYTVIFRFAKPYGLFPRFLAYRGLQRALFSPRHYLERYHPQFTDPDELQRLAAKEGFISWDALFQERNDLEKNPDLPTLGPFVCTVPFPSARCLAERNPYYWKVDPQGRQLPYIDQIAYTTVLDTNVLNMKAMDGEVDFQTRHINPGNYTLFKESSDKAANPNNRYRVQVSPGTGTAAVYINQYSRDEMLRPILQDRRFRIALSVAINREELNEMVYSGLATANNGVSIPQYPAHIDGIDQLYTQYDPAQARRLLDEVGLKRVGEGLRRLPNGEEFRQIMHVFPSEGGDAEDMWLLIGEYWREIGLHFVVKHEDGALSSMQVRNGNSDFWAYGTATMHWELDGVWRVPISASSYYAPLYGLYNYSQGKAGVRPPPEHQRLIDWYEQIRSTPSDALRTELLQRIMRQWADECYIVGICNKPEIFIISNRFRNVPDQILHDYRLMSPGYIGIEQFWIDLTSPSARRGQRRNTSGAIDDIIRAPAVMHGRASTGTSAR
jgi:peptide/nickel transport system substrate-binding protein